MLNVPDIIKKHKRIKQNIYNWLFDSLLYFSGDP